MTLTRKEFLSSVVGGAAGAALLVACGGDESGDDGPANCVMNGATADIGANHGHVLSVSSADISMGTAKTYGIQGSADHTHSVTISATAFASLANNTQATANSTSGGTDGHTHTVTIVCR